ncbi:MAG: 3-oxoacyl-ACP reductase [Acidimicrobiales bacterium]|jgi:NAD(P)-dependent dehydrogenase (short-subunit alcohol dehydrogenase family)|nr:3-oxoacyl-ACP reductase [Acidimicrobiales bacterium]
MLRRMSTPQRYADKIVLVTGAASGIGRATALRVAEEGGSVACLDVAADGAEKTAAEIGGRAKAYGCNVADEDSVTAAVAAVVGDFGRLDVTCNIAGIGKFAHTVDASKDEWDRIIAVNLTGTFLMCRASIPHLLETGGNIVNTASTAGVIGQPYSAAYCASKGGVRLLTQALAWEFVDRGIRVNAVAPGGVQTPLIQNFGFPEGANLKLFDKITSPMGWCQPEEVAGLFAYLGSDEARYINGALFTIDGGMTC